MDESTLDGSRSERHPNICRFDFAKASPNPPKPMAEETSESLAEAFAKARGPRGTEQKCRGPRHSALSMKDVVRTILFDWDGTLLDSFPAGYHASVSVLRQFGVDVDRARFLETYSPNWYESYRILGIPETEWSRADLLWREVYGQQTSELFPFVDAVLDQLREAGFALGLVTSGNRDRVLGELERFGLVEHFAAIVCFEDTHEKKPHPAPLVAGLEKLSASPSTTVYVGDRPEDIHMGRRVGTFTIGVESEYVTREILVKAAPDLLLPDASHLPQSFGIE